MPRTNSTNWSVADQISATRLQDFNEDLDDIYSLGPDRGRIVQSSLGALKIDIGAFTYRVGSIIGLMTAQTGLVVTDSATNYVEIDDTGTIQIGTSTWTSNRARIGTVVCSGGVITAINIYKPDVVGGDLGGAIIAYNTKTTITDGTVYQASNKGGFVVAAAGSNIYDVIIYSDASNPPTSIVARIGVSNSQTVGTKTTGSPILPNAYYKTTGANSFAFFYENI